MTDYAQQYYFVYRTETDDRIPDLKADGQTSMLDYQSGNAPVAAPLVFSNAWREEHRAANIGELVSDVLFEGSNMVVCSRIRERLLSFNFEHVVLYPTVYIDDQDGWHEDYWYVAFRTTFDCWDRSRSEYLDRPVTIGDRKLYAIAKYALNKELLDRTALENRLLFQMGGSSEALVVAHESIVPLFASGDARGVTLKKISDY